MSLLLHCELSQQCNRGLSLLSETLQGGRERDFHTLELIRARLLDRWTEIKKESANKTQSNMRESK